MLAAVSRLLALSFEQANLLAAAVTSRDATTFSDSPPIDIRGAGSGAGPRD
jgi:hypothetical protein